MRGVFLLILTGFFLGTTGIWAKLAGADVSPFLLTMLRTLFSAFMILLLIIFSKGIKTAENLAVSKKDAPLFLAAGFFGVAIGFGLYIKSFSFVPVANAVALVYVYPVVTALLSFVFLREKITKWEIAAVFLILLGVWSIYGPEVNLSSNAFGNLLALAAGIGYSVFIVFMRHFGLMLTFFLPFEQFAFSPSGLVPIFILGIALSSFFGYIFYAGGLKTVRAHDAVIITALTEPLSAIAIAFILLGESLPQHVLLGASLIVLANVLVGMEFRKKRKGKAKAKTGEGFGWVW
jgi:drug/metabolite transporter (DMT)-like permease